MFTPFGNMCFEILQRKKQEFNLTQILYIYIFFYLLLNLRDWKIFRLFENHVLTIFGDEPNKCSKMKFCGIFRQYMKRKKI